MDVLFAVIAFNDQPSRKQVFPHGNSFSLDGVGE